MAMNHSELRQAVIDSANMLVRIGAISMSHHGNFSVRVPNTDTILLTATSSFDNLKPENLAMLDLDGKLIEGEINPTNAEIVHMHAIVYKERPDTGAVVHTHSTYATSFALASRSIGCSYEALVRSDMTDGIPLAKYGPRGSAESVSNIADALSRDEKYQSRAAGKSRRVGVRRESCRGGTRQSDRRGSGADGNFRRSARRREKYSARNAKSHSRSKRRIRPRWNATRVRNATQAFGATKCRGDRRSPDHQ